MSVSFQIHLTQYSRSFAQPYDLAVTVIPCSNLAIGSWRRIATSSINHDLIAYVSYEKRCMNWFIRSGGYGFKMELPFESITDVELTNAGPDSSAAAFALSRPPNFYLEDVSSTTSDGLRRTWKRCSDWTEGHQASQVLQHTLVGSSSELMHVVKNLPRKPHSAQQPSSQQSLLPLEIPVLEGAEHRASLYAVPERSHSRSWQNHGPFLRSAPRNDQSMNHPDPRALPPPHSAPAISSQHTSLSHRGSVSAGFEPRSHNSFHTTSHPVPSTAAFHHSPMAQSSNLPSNVAQLQYLYDNNHYCPDSQPDTVQPVLSAMGYTNPSSNSLQYRTPTNFYLTTSFNTGAELSQLEPRLTPEIPGGMYELSKHSRYI